jgi:hypothetical protein
MEELTSRWTDFPEVFHVEGFTDNIKVWLRLRKTTDMFHVYTSVFIVISSLICLASRNVSDKSCSKNEDTVHVKHIFSPSAVVAFPITKHATKLNGP